MPGARREGGSDKRNAGDVRERILDAAIAILRTSGLQRLTQVQVAEAAGVRQSHLTYYFPTRVDLLEAITTRAVAGIAGGVERAVREEGASSDSAVLDRLTRSIADVEHMRMFLGLVIEADGDRAVRKLITTGTARLEAALADALGGENAQDRARLALTTIWGLGLYHFVMRPSAASDPTSAHVAWLAQRATTPRKRPRARRGRSNS